MMIKIYMENRLRLFAFHLWSLVLCSRTAFVWTMMSFHYDNRILKPAFCLVLQVWAFLFLTSMRSTNLNMKGKKKHYVIMQYTEKWQKVLLNQICMTKASCFVSTALQQTWLLDLDFLEKHNL